MDTKKNKKPIKVPVNIVIDKSIADMIDVVQRDLNIKSISEALRVLLKKGSDQYQREKAILSKTN